MNNFKREDCRLCISKDLELVVPLSPTPVAEKYLTAGDLKTKKELIYPLDLYMCSSCGHVQLLDVIDPKFLYDDYTYCSGNSPGLVKHFSEYADYITENFKFENNDLVVDIGSNDGTLLYFFKKKGFKVVGVDPAEEVAKLANDRDIETYTNFFDSKTTKEIISNKGKAKIITANNAYAHMDDLNSLTKNISKLLQKDGIFVFEISYLLDVIENNLLGTIFHEHHSYHSIKPLKKFFKKFNMELIDITRNNIQGGSLVGITQFIGGPYKAKDSVKEIEELETKKKIDQVETLRLFSKKLNNHISEIKDSLEKIKKEGKSIAGFGAARSGTTLISQFKIGEVIDYIVDDSSYKQGKFSPGEHLLVKPTNEIYSKNKPDYLIILAWVHAKKIIKEHQRFLNNGGAFIICFPEFKIIKK